MIFFLSFLLTVLVVNHAAADQVAWVDPADRVVWVNKLPTQEEFRILPPDTEVNAFFTTPTLPLGREAVEEVLLEAVEMTQKARALYDQYIVSEGIDFSADNADKFENGLLIVHYSSSNVEVRIFEPDGKSPTVAFCVASKDGDLIDAVVYNHALNQPKLVTSQNMKSGVSVEFRYIQNGSGLKSYVERGRMGRFGPRLEWNDEGALVRAEYYAGYHRY